jgi:hypothetical protein
MAQIIGLRGLRRVETKMKISVVGIGLTLVVCAAQAEPTAQGMDLVDGAIVCRSLDLASYIYGQINQARHARQTLPPELRRQAMLTNGEDPGAEPKPSDYGCVLVPVGTSLTVEPGNYVPVVSGMLPNGRRFKGVTLPTMVEQ